MISKTIDKLKDSTINGLKSVAMPTSLTKVKANWNNNNGSWKVTNVVKSVFFSKTTLLSSA